MIVVATLVPVGTATDTDLSVELPRVVKRAKLTSFPSAQSAEGTANAVQVPQATESR